ncbi:Hachiman antiphage defense system protein HamA [Massilia antarctica]|uniref:Hachiman antiphage defense system protein HamA n=1 Tax=Massilia antarctica TaxID=2765360 RepID=UPI00226D530C|nr:Hachiman antiphage defense system protein HamA [Massilia sp. H27-R4]MCY0911023.1 SAVED domain-containing protein [Massilia sp. H27-R4]
MKKFLLQCLKNSGSNLYTADGHEIQVFELAQPIAAATLTQWASKFRQNYCLDQEIDELREGTGFTRSEFLHRLIFPDATEKPGPSIRAGDFAEILLADYVEFSLGFWVPRDKYAMKASRNESAKGVDIMGLKLKESGGYSAEDELITYEVKAQLSATKYSGRLQHAIDDSSKDYLRSAMNLHALKHRLIRAKQSTEAQIVQRFQNKADRPYRYRSGAAAVLCGRAYDETEILTSNVGNHNNVNDLELIVIRGSDLMSLAHALYTEAADEA